MGRFTLRDEGEAARCAFDLIRFTLEGEFKHLVFSFELRRLRIPVTYLDLLSGTSGIIYQSSFV